MSRPLLLDLYCGAGGAARGYHDAGFDVIGVDINPQPRYPYEFILDDALRIAPLLLRDVHAIHASPPCQGYSQMSNCRPGLANSYERLVDATRDLLTDSGLPWVIENVEYAGLPHQSDLYGSHGLMLCGAMFGLRTYRHRYFGTSSPMHAPNHPRHLTPTSRAGHWEPGTFISVAGGGGNTALKREAMGIDWMNRDELSEAIPPAYTRFIGEQLLAHLEIAA